MKKQWWQDYYLFCGMFSPKTYIKYVDEPVDVPALPEGFTPDALTGDNWANIQNMDEFKENGFLRNTKSFKDAIEQATNAQTLIGQDRLPQPKDDWGEEEWAAHWNRLGRPESPDKYALDKESISVPEGFELNDELLAEANKELHGLGLNQKQYEGAMGAFFKWLGTSANAGNAQQEAQYTTAQEALQAEFGDQYDANVQKGNALIAEFGDADTSKFLADSGLGNNPHFVKMMVNIANQFGDDTAIGQSIGSSLSPANKAKADIAELKADESFRKILMNETAPGHKDAVRKWHDLHKLAFPSK